MTEKKNIVIVGGGYAGVNLVPKIEKFLPASHRIVLIEEQEFFYHKIAALRAAASEDIADKVLVPFERFFKSDTTGIVVKASVTDINPHSVILSQPHKLFGAQVPFEYLIIATGSSWNDPVELHTKSRKEAIALMAEKRAEVAAAKNIVIVGAGAVGIELFGEINLVNPNANVTIIQGANLPLNAAYTDGFRQKVKKEVENRGGKFLFNEKANLTSADTKAVNLQSGKTLTADLVFVSAGATPRGEIIKTLDATLYNPESHTIKVNDKLQVVNSAYPNIFAAGDVADTKEVKMAYKASLHAPVVAANIQSLIKGQEPTTVYTKPAQEMLALPLGKSGGVTYLPFFGGFTLGNWFTKMVKGGDLLVDKTSKTVLRW